MLSNNEGLEYDSTLNLQHSENVKTLGTEKYGRLTIQFSRVDAH